MSKDTGLAIGLEPGVNPGVAVGVSSGVGVGVISACEWLPCLPPAEPRVCEVAWFALCFPCACDLALGLAA
jgi:hypothetical protein